MNPKTVENITEWMSESKNELKIPDEYYGLLASEGGSNAIGYIQEFEVVGRVADEGGGRSNNQDFVICFSHQNERSGGWASDTSGFVDKPNEDLGLLLKKNYAIQKRVNRNAGRVEVFQGVKKRKGRIPPISPDPANEFPWQGENWFFNCSFSTYY